MTWRREGCRTCGRCRLIGMPGGCPGPAWFEQSKSGQHLSDGCARSPYEVAAAPGVIHAFDLGEPLTDLIRHAFVGHVRDSNIRTSWQPSPQSNSRLRADVHAVSVRLVDMQHRDE